VRDCIDVIVVYYMLIYLYSVKVTVTGDDANETNSTAANATDDAGASTNSTDGSDTAGREEL
jgi:hypothetical protein